MIIHVILEGAVPQSHDRLRGHPGKPQALSLEITHHCIAKCIMCNIWKIPREVPDLPVDQWLGLLASPHFSDLRELDITGGEPYLVEDLPQLFAGIRDLKGHSLKALRSIAITTNGILIRRELDYTVAPHPGVCEKNFGNIHFFSWAA